MIDWFANNTCGFQLRGSFCLAWEHMLYDTCSIQLHASTNCIKAIFREQSKKGKLFWRVRKNNRTVVHLPIKFLLSNTSFYSQIEKLITFSFFSVLFTFSLSLFSCPPIWLLCHLFRNYFVKLEHFILMHQKKVHH